LRHAGVEPEKEGRGKNKRMKKGQPCSLTKRARRAGGKRVPVREGKRESVGKKTKLRRRQAGHVQSA